MRNGIEIEAVRKKKKKDREIAVFTTAKLIRVIGKKMPTGFFNMRE